jgi:hypothetical protein
VYVLELLVHHLCKDASAAMARQNPDHRDPRCRQLSPGHGESELEVGSGPDHRLAVERADRAFHIEYAADPLYLLFLWAVAERRLDRCEEVREFVVSAGSKVDFHGRDPMWRASQLAMHPFDFLDLCPTSSFRAAPASDWSRSSDAGSKCGPLPRSSE